MAKLVTADLPRAYTWRASDDEPELEYGPGKVQIPLLLAERLKARQHIEGWAEYSGDEPQPAPMPDRILPGQELAPDFPAREYLFMAGHTTYGHVVELNRDQLLALPGIGEAKADAIIAERAKAIIRMPVSETEAQPITIARSVEEPPTRRGVRRAPGADVSEAAETTEDSHGA